ncbi:MAG: BrnT family toxin [Nitrospirota bacterium]
MTDLQVIEGFDWDTGNARKSEKHGVTQTEAEQVFFNEPLLMLHDEKHSHSEERFHALGKTNEGRLLHITFTLRAEGTKIRVISARNMHPKERKVYETKTQTHP